MKISRKREYLRDLLLSEAYLEAMDGSGALKTVQKSTVGRSGGCVCPPRGPCESLPGAALWANILRVLYLHDNSIPKNELWRNGWKPGEVIGCRLGQGEGPGGVASAAKKKKKKWGGCRKVAL